MEAMAISRPSVVWAISAIALAGCYDSHGLDGPAPPVDPTCGEPDLACVQPRDGACGPWEIVAPECAGRAWRCPAGSREHEAVEPEEGCRPFAGGPFTRVHGAGFLLPDADTCRFVLDGVDLEDGSFVEFPAVTAAPAPFGACPEVGDVIGPPRSVLDRSVIGDMLAIALHDAARVDGTTWVFYRRYVFDPAEPFLFRSDGTSVARWDEERRRIRVDDRVTWPPIQEYGDAAFLHDGALHAVGCYGEPDFLTFRCRLARTTAADPTAGAAWEYFAGRDWSPAADDAAVVFNSGPEQSAVRFVPGLDRWVLLFVAGFGSEVEIRTAPAPQGPWRAARRLVRCDLPPDDEQAFCREPVLHLDRMDPLRPDRLVVSYAIETLADDGDARRRADPRAYWPRMVHVTP